MRAGARDIVAGDDGGPRRLQEKCGDLGEPLWIRRRGTPQLVRTGGFNRGFLFHHVNRERNEDRPFGRIGRDLESTAQDGGHLVRPLHLHAPLGDRCGHGDEVMAKQRIGQPHARILLSRGDDERRIGLQCAVQRAHRIAEPRRDVDVGNGRAPGGLRIETRRADCDALVQGHDVFDLRIGGETVQQRRFCGAGIAEDMAHAVRDQGFHQHTPSAHFPLLFLGNDCVQATASSALVQATCSNATGLMRAAGRLPVQIGRALGLTCVMATPVLRAAHRQSTSGSCARQGTARSKPGRTPEAAGRKARRGRWSIGQSARTKVRTRQFLR